MLQPDKNTKNTGNTVIPNNLRPVSYASKTLTSSESNYSNIEHELLGVLFSVLHFKHFTYGCKVHMIMDHKPLVSLFKTSLTSASPRLSRMLLCIIDYQLDVMYQLGTKMHLSDALSRLTSHNDTSKANAIPGLDISVHDVDIFKEMSVLSLAKNKEELMSRQFRGLLPFFQDHSTSESIKEQVLILKEKEKQIHHTSAYDLPVIPVGAYSKLSQQRPENFVYW